MALRAPNVLALALMLSIIDHLFGASSKGLFEIKIFSNNP